jgi:hypothetical protein
MDEYHFHWNADYREFLRRPLYLMLDGADAWWPRDILLIGELDSNGERRWVPLAHAFDRMAQPWVNDRDHWKLTVIDEVHAEHPLQDLVVTLATAECKASRGRRNWGATPGPIQMSVFADGGGFPLLLYQTQLPVLGLKSPGSLGSYYVRCAVRTGVPFTAARLTTVQFSNLSAVAWKPVYIRVFGLDVTGTKGRLLGSTGATTCWVSQDPYDVPEGEHVDRSITLHVDLDAEVAAVRKVWRRALGLSSHN